MTTPRGFGLGLIPDGPDDRDRLYAPPPVTGTLPEFVDLEPDPATPPVWNQGQLGSCTAHGTLACFLWASAKCGANDPMLSRLQLYWNTRAIEGSTGYDSGGQIRDAVKATTSGIAPEALWPYDVAQFTVQPPANVVQAGQANVGLTYERVAQDADHIRACLAGGFPIDIGVLLYRGFESAKALKTGVVAMPGRMHGNPIGGHCMAVWGYGTGEQWKAHGQFPAARDTSLYVKVRNSWGTDVYQRGYLLMRMDYLTDPQLGSDYWRIERVS